jgi:hypothetical protein
VASQPVALAAVSGDGVDVTHVVHPWIVRYSLISGQRSP